MPTITDRKLKPKSDLGRRLLLLCEAKGHRSLAEAARACGMSYQQLYAIVKAYHDPKWSTVEKIVVGLGAGMDDLIGPVDGDLGFRLDDSN